MSTTPKKYDRKTLAFFLADLGETIKRAPRPSDLKKGMPSRSTIIRHFGTWNDALLYAGFTEDKIQGGTSKEDSTKKAELASESTNFENSEKDNKKQVKLINLINHPVVIVGPRGESEVFKSSGYAKIVKSMPYIPRVSMQLAPQIAACPILSFATKYLCVEREDGAQFSFPPYVEGTYYLVTESVARNAHRFGRTNRDLIFPRFQDSYYASGILHVSSLRMVYNKKTSYV